MSGIYSKKILILENDAPVLKRLIEQFSLAEYECETASDLPSFMSLAMRVHPDLAVIDVSMPEFDGFNVLEALKSDAQLSAIPVVIGSAQGDLVEISRGLRLGIKDYYVKSSFDAAQVVEKIKKHLGDMRKLAVAPESGAELAMIKLLIVEDDKFLRDLAAQKLSKEHLQVFVAVDGEQGIGIAIKVIPNIILLDILLPGIDGFEVLKRIRSNPALDATHVVMLSNFGQREDIERALKAGADDFMIKANFTLDEVVTEVKRIIATPRVPTKL